MILLALAFYFVKVVLDPFGFTFADELIHASNANTILTTHELFHANSILPVAAYYPGLETVTAALASTSGLGSFGAGLVVVGAARLVVMLALYLLFERLSGSSRVAALGAAIYTANSNFIFWSSQFSYESLALPLLVVVLLGVTELRSGTARTGWTLASALIALAVVTTHHMTSYALNVSLAALCGAYWVVGRRRPDRAPWRLAAFTLLATVAWLTFVASATVGYLTPIFTQAVVSTVHTLTGEAAPRHLFGSSSGGSETPLLERGVGVVSVLLIVAGFPFGARTAWRRFRADPLVLVFLVAATGFFGTLGLRFAPAAWEVGNRASEFLFIGLAFVLALVGLERWSPGRAPWLGRAAVTACLGILVAGGVIAGWKPFLRLGQPYRITAGGSVIEAESPQVADWAATHLPPGRRVAASDSDARLLATDGRQFALAGWRFADLLQTSTLPHFEISTMRINRLQYVAVDLRLKSFDNMLGYYFGFRPGAGTPDRVFAPDTASKFDGIRADRLYDSGNIIVYQVASTYEPPTP